MTRKRELTGLGFGVIAVLVIGWFGGGLATVVTLKAPDANRDGYHHFTTATWLAVIVWLTPFVVAGLGFGLRWWWTHGRPGLWRWTTQPQTKDLRDDARSST